ncbi:precorrin-2 dehydrogenase/sirohydrochlorin ferrochelatase family protein [Cohnella fermenti]|uniref:precorrin-2 dehydrogenase n=1 Tax=Cohnella fermenti TaxID=2565925 RepID=A0A4S4CCU1_9BACL|nr:bifunctional precorrin-2 dehydrogenase/sirohydrochlorin ferrochelatase [Cohnella fermenti]THF83782.1 bifunctional precorrin-2 dehydrogenase/sirohydrochlorin ferrochelatase [Cohnella fermenti]
MVPGYPVVLHLENRLCVVAGGGAVAERKAAGLLEAGASVLVVAPTLAPQLKRWAEEGRIRTIERAAEPSDLDGAALLFAATDKPEINRLLAEEARARGIPANLADRGDEGDFVTPAVVRRGRLLFAVSASGAGPAFASRLAAELSERYGEEYARLAEQLYKLRRAVLASVSDPARRRSLLREAVADRAIELWKACPADVPEGELLGLLLRLDKEKDKET